MIKSTNLVVKGNQLVEARYKLTIWESRVFAKMVTMIDKDDEHFTTYKINIKELMDFFGTQSSNDYKKIRGVPEMLLKKVVKIPIVVDGKKKLYKTTFVSASIEPDEDTLKADNSTIELRFDPGLKPYLLKLKEQFLQYDIKNILRIASPNSIRIYELLKQYERIGYRIITVKEIKEILGIENKYKLYGHLKNRVFKQAQKDLAEHTDIIFTFKEIKKGRKVESIKFIIFKNPAKQEKPKPPKKKKQAQKSPKPPSTQKPQTQPSPPQPTAPTPPTNTPQPLIDILPKALQSQGMEMMLKEGIKYETALNILELFDNETELLQEVRAIKQQLMDRRDVQNKAGLMVKLLKEQNFKKKRVFQEAKKAQVKSQQIDFEAHAQQIEAYRKEYREKLKTVVMHFLASISEEQRQAYVDKYRAIKPAVCETIDLAREQGDKEKANNLAFSLYIREIPNVEHLYDFHQYLSLVHRCQLTSYQGRTILEQKTF